MAELVILLPHSNEGKERLFSTVLKNKTDRGSSLKLEGIISNLLAMKLHSPEGTSACFKFNPDENLLSSACEKSSKSKTKGTNKVKNTLFFLGFFFSKPPDLHVMGVGRPVHVRLVRSDNLKIESDSTRVSSAHWTGVQSSAEITFHRYFYGAKRKKSDCFFWTESNTNMGRKRRKVDVRPTTELTKGLLLK